MVSGLAERIEVSRPEFNAPDVYASLTKYFSALKTQERTDSGALRDRFSFMYPTAQWEQLINSGVEAGYGIEWKLLSAVPPRLVKVAYVEADSPASRAGIQRGDTLVSANGISVDVNTSQGVAGLNRYLFPPEVGINGDLVFDRAGSTIRASLVSANIAHNPVPQSTVLSLANGTKAGYLVFHDHSLPAEAKLISAVNDFSKAGVQELILDLRYNGGGYLFIASQLAMMIAGRDATNGAVFEKSRYNSRRTSDVSATPFYNRSCLLADGNCTVQRPLPSLGLKRVYVLAQSGTCSASEAVINGLRGINVDVILIGGTTCGKPYGFTAKDNCGVSYFPIEFEGVNAMGFGDYADGFAVGPGPTARFLPGCSVADDVTTELGSSAEPMLAAAMEHAVSGRCPPARSAQSTAIRSEKHPGSDAFLELARHPARANRILLNRR